MLTGPPCLTSPRTNRLVLIGLVLVLGSFVIGRAEDTATEDTATEDTATEDTATEDEPPTDWAQVIADLGHERWQRREAAQTKLEKRARAEKDGAVIVDMLREAASSGDPEMARRARRLRERVDPLVGAFEVVEIQLSPSPRVSILARGSSQSGEDVSFIVESIPPPEGETRIERTSHSARRYSLSWQATGAEEYDVEISENSLRSRTRVSLREPLNVAPSISLLKVGEVTKYSRNETLAECRRFPFVVLLRQRYVRQSEYAGMVAGTNDTLLVDLLAELELQAASESIPARAQAIELLGHLRHAPAKELLASALEENRLKFAAAMALGRLGDPRGLDQLKRLLANPPIEDGTSTPENPDDRLAPPDPARVRAERIRTALEQGVAIDDSDRVRAAAVLTKAAPDKATRDLGLTYLILRLENRDLSALYTVYSTLVDQRDAIVQNPQLRRRFLTFALQIDGIGEAPWSFFWLETEYFFTCVLGLLDPEDPEDREAARSAVDGFQGLLLGRWNFVQMRFSSVLPIWKLAARVAFAERDDSNDSTAADDSSFDPTDETRLLERALAGVSSSTSLSEISSRIRTMHRGRVFSESFLEALFGSFLRLSRESDANLARSARRYAREISSTLTIGPSQLELVVRGLYEIEAAAAKDAKTSGTTTTVSSTYSVASELTRLTGVTLPRRSAARGRYPIPIEKIAEWLDDKEAVARRQAELNAESTKPDDDAPWLEFFEFQLETTEDPSAGTSFAVVSGHATLIRVGETTRLSSSDGRPHIVTLVPTKSNQSSSSPTTRVGSSTARRAPTASPTRYRLNSSNWLTEGVYQLTTSTQTGRGTKWYEVSDVEPRAQYVQVSTKTRSQRILFVTPFVETNTAKGTPSKSGTSPFDALPKDGRKRLDALWRLFLDRHLLRPPENPNSYQRSSIVRAIRTLRLREAIPMLKKWLGTHPSFELAGILRELGDPVGNEYLRTQLESPSTTSRIAAARTLSDSGDPLGMEALLRFSKEHPREFTQSVYTILQSFDKFITTAEESSSTRLRAIDFVFENLHNTRYQTVGFRIVKNLAGNDFGYAQSRIRTKTPGASGTVTRRVPSTEVIASARKWWAKERARLSSE